MFVCVYVCVRERGVEDQDLSSKQVLLTANLSVHIIKQALTALFFETKKSLP